MGGQPPRMEQGQQTPEKPSEAPEKPTGQKPADAPKEPEDLIGERPEMPSGEKPADAPEMPGSEKQSGTGDTQKAPEKLSEAPEKPSGEKPSDAPEMPSGEQGQAPTGQQPTDGQQTPKMIDFDAMVTSGVISQETGDAIKAYMDEHKLEGEMPTVPAEGEAPAESKPSLPRATMIMSYMSFTTVLPVKPEFSRMIALPSMEPVGGCIPMRRSWVQK